MFHKIQQNDVIDLFMAEIDKHVSSTELLKVLKHYLTQIDEHSTMRYLVNELVVVTNKDYESLKQNLKVVSACLSVLKLSQNILNHVCFDKSMPLDKRTESIMASLMLYSTVFQVIKSNIPENAVEIIKTIKEAYVLTNSPRADNEESETDIKWRTIYYLDFYLPLKLLNLNYKINEDFFALYFLIGGEEEELIKYYKEKLGSTMTKEEIDLHIETKEEGYVVDMLRIIAKENALV